MTEPDEARIVRSVVRLWRTAMTKIQRAEYEFEIDVCHRWGLARLRCARTLLARALRDLASVRPTATRLVVMDEIGSMVDVLDAVIAETIADMQARADASLAGRSTG